MYATVHVAIDLQGEPNIHMVELDYSMEGIEHDGEILEGKAHH